MVCKSKRIAVSLATLMIALITLIAFVPSSIHAARDWGGYMWKVQGKRIYEGTVSGRWRTGIRAKADGGAGDTIQMGTTKAVSNSISSSCGISRKGLNASFKFDVSRTWSTTASKSYGLSGKKRGSWWAIRYKPVYKKYKIRVRRYSFTDGRWHRLSKTKWIYAKRFDHFAYKLVKSKAPK